MVLRELLCKGCYPADRRERAPSAEPPDTACGLPSRGYAALSGIMLPTTS